MDTPAELIAQRLPPTAVFELIERVFRYANRNQLERRIDELELEDSRKADLISDQADEIFRLRQSIIISRAKGGRPLRQLSDQGALF